MRRSSLFLMVLFSVAMSLTACKCGKKDGEMQDGAAMEEGAEAPAEVAPAGDAAPAPAGDAAPAAEAPVAAPAAEAPAAAPAN